MDRTTKLLLAAIAAGLFANAMRPAQAQIAETQLTNIANSIQAIAEGGCTNTVLCSQMVRRP